MGVHGDAPVFGVFVRAAHAGGRVQVPEKFRQRDPDKFCAGDFVLPAAQTAPVLDILPLRGDLPHRGVHRHVSGGCLWRGGRKALWKAEKTGSFPVLLPSGVLCDGMCGGFYPAYDVADCVSDRHGDGACGRGPGGCGAPQADRAAFLGAWGFARSVPGQLSDDLHVCQDGSRRRERSDPLRYRDPEKDGDDLQGRSDRLG